VPVPPAVPPPVVPPVVPPLVVPPVAAPVPPVAAPVPAEPVPAEPVLPDVPEAAPDDDVPDPLPEPVEVPDGVALDAVVSVWVVEVEVLPEDPDDEPIEALAGAIRSGVDFGTTSWSALEPPQADTPPVATSSRARAVARRRMTGWVSPTGRRRDPCGGHTSGSR
jgi:hypothetical protein